MKDFVEGKEAVNVVGVTWRPVLAVANSRFGGLLCSVHLVEVVSDAANIAHSDCTYGALEGARQELHFVSNRVGRGDRRGQRL